MRRPLKTEQAGKCHINPFHLPVQVFEVRLAKKSELSCEFELRVQLAQRAACCVKKLGKFFLAFAGRSFGNIARNAAAALRI